MMKFLKSYLSRGAALGLSLVLTGCDFMRVLGYGYNEITLAPVVYALEDLNTPYDDYNAGPPPDPYVVEDIFLYAGNALSKGKHFDILKGRLFFEQSAPRGYDTETEPALLSESLGGFMPEFNSEANEFGPIFLRTKDVLPETQAITPVIFGSYPSFDSTHANIPPDQELLAAASLFAFGSDRENQQRDIWIYHPPSKALKKFAGNDPQADEVYLSYDPRRQTLYFSSDRSGKFKLYQAKKPEDVEVFTWLTSDTPLEAQEMTALNADGDTTCPFVWQDILIFTSNRSGGKGGYDLYYTQYQAGAWQTPKNLQAVLPDRLTLNTAADEFRPSLLRNMSSIFPEQDFILFSSNRKGGKGGYDLYLAPWIQAE